MEYKYTAIITNKRDIGETDRFYTLYSAEAGKITAVAKGVRRSGARLAAALETFNLADVTVQKSRGRGNISGAIIEQGFWRLKNSPQGSLLALATLKEFDRLVQGEVRDEKVFLLLHQYLHALERAVNKNLAAEKLRLVDTAFRLQLLEALGYALQLETCSDCAASLGAGQLFFSPSLGGIVCPECAKHDRSVIALSANAWKLARLSQKNSLESIIKVSCPPKDVASLRRMLDAFAKWIY